MANKLTCDPEGGIWEWLKWGRTQLGFLGQEEALWECEQMLGALLGVSRTELYLSAQPDPFTFSRFSQWVRARKERIPLAYISERTHFWEDCFKIEEGVFVPRPETEGLIEAFSEASGFRQDDPFRFLDLGTGSGVIAVTMAKVFPRSQGIACDLSWKAIRLAARNSEGLGVKDRITFLQGDGLLGFEKESFDVIFSNPPYVASRDWDHLEPEVQREPRLALDGGVEGLDFYHRIFEGLSCLKRGGSLWVEVGFGEAEEVKSLFESRGFERVRIFKDLNGIDRVIAGIGLNG